MAVRYKFDPLSGIVKVTDPKELSDILRREKYIRENPFSEEDVLDEIDRIRNIRNSLLSSSDWTQVSDNNLSEIEKQEWAAYRQELRDITESLYVLLDSDGLDSDGLDSDGLDSGGEEHMLDWPVIEWPSDPNGYAHQD